jgi:hypothetical protein
MAGITLWENMAQNPLVLHFTALVDGWSAAGWGEYLLWETLEGKRDRPFQFLPPLPEADLEMCRRLRDELKTWPTWDGVSWKLADIDEWRAHTKVTTAKDVRDAMGGS